MFLNRLVDTWRLYTLTDQCVRPVRAYRLRPGSSPVQKHPTLFKAVSTVCNGTHALVWNNSDPHPIDLAVAAFVWPRPPPVSSTLVQVLFRSAPTPNHRPHRRPICTPQRLPLLSIL